jgi:hypothetical protein
MMPIGRGSEVTLNTVPIRSKTVKWEYLAVILTLSNNEL